jgi:hypothetical protein
LAELLSPPWSVLVQLTRLPASTAAWAFSIPEPEGGVVRVVQPVHRPALQVDELTREIGQLAGDVLARVGVVPRPGFRASPLAHALMVGGMLQGNPCRRLDFWRRTRQGVFVYRSEQKVGVLGKLALSP